MANLKKSVFSVEMECYKCKKEALQCISRVEGVDMVKIDLEKKTITVEGEADPASITNQLRVKFKSARLVSTAPLLPPKKDDDKKKSTEDKSQEKQKNGKGSTQQAEANGAKKQKDTKKENPGDSKDKEQTKQKVKSGEKEDGKKEDKQPQKEKQKETTNKAKEAGNPPKQDEQQIRFFPTYPPCVVHYPCPPVSHCRCSDCSCRSDMLWPRYQPPAPRTEVWYVTNEETPSYCTIS